MTVFNTPILRTLNYFIGTLFIKMTGWKIQGEAPTDKKYVLICAPHTSNWDLVYLLAFAFHFRLDIRWLGKNSLFKFPFHHVMTWLGGVKIDRSKPNGVVGQLSDWMKSVQSMVLAVPPEGTRSRVRKWKTGFYHIANGAKIPIALGFIDYSRKCLGIGPMFSPTGDAEADIPEIQKFYKDVKGKKDQTSLNE